MIQNDKNPKKPNIEYLCAGFMKLKSNKNTLNFLILKTSLKKK